MTKPVQYHDILPPDPSVEAAPPCESTLASFATTVQECVLVPAHHVDVPRDWDTEPRVIVLGQTGVVYEQNVKFNVAAKRQSLEKRRLVLNRVERQDTQAGPTGVHTARP